MLISILINNYNYGRYLRQAIDSVINQSSTDWELIVVDDGSTDDSREVIASYGDRLRSVLKANGGQGSAYNAGFEASRGDFALFLDSDDVLQPDAIGTIVSRISEGVVKVQFPLEVVDQDLAPLGARMPTIRMLQGDVRQSLLRYGAYGSPPGSGNCYARSFLTQVLPMPEPEWRICADAYLILQAPLHGDVVNVDRPLALYRQHRSAAKPSGEKTSLAGNAYGLAKLLKLLDQEEKLIAEIAKAQGVPHSPVANHNPSYTKNLLCAKLLDQAPEGAPERSALAWTGFRNSLRFPMYSPRVRLLSAAWFLWAGLAPKRRAIGSVRLALDPTSRPSAGPRLRNGVRPA